MNQDDRRSNLGRRRRAAKAGGMRPTCACLRCFGYHIECDELEPCSQCQRNMPTWNLRCTRQQLSDRLSYLLLDILTAHLDLIQIRSFVDTNAKWYVGDTLYLPLAQFSGEDRIFWMSIRKVEPLELALVERSPCRGLSENNHFLEIQCVRKKNLSN